MRTYLLYFFTGLLTFYITLFLFGISAGFANITPVLAIIGSVLIFSLATPFLIIKRKIGIMLGLISCGLIFPFILGFTFSLFEDGALNIGTLFGFLPIILLLLAIYNSFKTLKLEQSNINISLKYVLIIIPVGITILYVIFYGKYWI